MTAPRKTGRYTPPKLRPPKYLVEAADKQHCPDCNSDVALVQDESGRWNVEVAHGQSCVQLAFRQRHRATRGAMIVAKPGHAIGADLVTEVAAVIGRGADRLRVSFGDRPGFDATEREMFDERGSN
jgi:hypothetical protein